MTKGRKILASLSLPVGLKNIKNVLIVIFAIILVPNSSMTIDMIPLPIPVCPSTNLLIFSRKLVFVLKMIVYMVKSSIKMISLKKLMKMLIIFASKPTLKLTLLKVSNSP